MSSHNLKFLNSLPSPLRSAPQEPVSTNLLKPDHPRCVDLTHCRLTVVAKPYWEAYSQQKKSVEFRSGNQSIALTEGMQLLFSLNASERRRGNTDLVCAEVRTVVLLTCAQACARFPVEAHACNLPKLCTNWHCDTVNCIVVKKNSLHRTKSLVNLAQGNVGILRQFVDTTGCPRFCHIDDLDRTLKVRSNTGKTETCSFHATWPTASNTLAARSAPGGAGGSKVSPLQRQDSFTQSQETLIRAFNRTQSLAKLRSEHCLDAVTLQAFKKMAKDCPVVQVRSIHKEICSVLELNVGNSISFHALKRFKMSLSDSQNSTLVVKTIQFVANLVAVSVLLDGVFRIEEWTTWLKKFRSWVMDTFRPECSRLLPSDLYRGDHWEGGVNPLEEAIVSFGLEPDSKTLPDTDWRCDKCLAIFSESAVTALVCKCGSARCNECFGVEKNQPDKVRRGRRAADRIYACERCLEEYSGEGLLYPHHRSKLCSCCLCDLTDPSWSARPARCRLCHRLYCEREAATCSLDSATASTATLIGCRRMKSMSPADKPLETSHLVASIECLFCIGRQAYVETRNDVFTRLARKMVTSVRNPLHLPADFNVRREDVRNNWREANEVGDFVYDLYFSGFRETAKQALGFLMKVLSVQVNPLATQSLMRPCVSVFNMLHLLGQHPLANPKMLEKVCLAHAHFARRDGSDLLEMIGDKLQPLKALNVSGSKRVGIYGENLYRAGPLVDLVAEALVGLSKLCQDRLEVFVFGVGTDYEVGSEQNHPPVKQLWEHFLQERRICFDPKANAQAKLKRLREASLDVFIALPGFTGKEDMGIILAAKAAPVQLNWLETACILYAQELVDYTILGQAVGDEQRQCPGREYLAEIEQPGTYQPPQSSALKAAVLARKIKKNRAFFGLLDDNFYLLVPGSTNRLDFDKELLHPYWAMLLRIPAFLILFDKPSGMRSYILKCLAEYNASQEASRKVDQSRIIFQEWFHDKGDFWEFITAVGLEGGRGTTICSFGAVCFHTGTGDALINLVSHYTWRDPNATMQQRVAAEIVTAAGLEWPCVADSPQGTVDAVVAYAHDRVLQDRMLEHMKRGWDENLGFYNKERCPRFLAYAVHAACAQKMAAGDDTSLLTDFKIPFEGPAMEALRPDNGPDPANQRRYTLLNEGGMAVEMQEVAATMLQGIEEETGCTLLGFQGAGSSTMVIRARFPNETEEAVIKISKEGCLPGQTHNKPLYREAKSLYEWHDCMKKRASAGLLPRPFKVLKGGTCFFGQSNPNDAGEVVNFLICEHIPRSFMDVAGTHRTNWQVAGMVEDSFRIDVLQPMCRGLFWAQNNGLLSLVFRDFKPDNVRFRQDGTMAVIDLGSSASCQVKKAPGQQAAFLERRATSIGADGKMKPGCGLLRGRPPKLGDKYVAILQDAMEVFARRVGDRGLALIGGTTKGFRDDELKTIADAFRVLNSRVLQPFNQSQGCHQDDYAFFRTVLFLLTYQEGVAIDTWDAAAKEAAEQGAKGIRRMLFAAAPSGMKIRQMLAVDRLVDFVHVGLRPVRRNEHYFQVRRWGMMEAMVHEFLTVAILRPDQEQELLSPSGLEFPHGSLRTAVQWPEGFLTALSPQVRVKVLGAVIPRTAAKLQPKMGVGLVALQDIPGDSLLGAYVGESVPNYQRGTVYDERAYPSRYNVTGLGRLKILTQQLYPATKFTCDAQHTSSRDVDWAILHGNSGPFMNASDSKASANCLVDRTNAWYDATTGLIWMLVWSKPQGIQKGQYCVWDYNPEAGAGDCWHFRGGGGGGGGGDGDGDGGGGGGDGGGRQGRRGRRSGGRR